jgi:hypothetical protein
MIIPRAAWSTSVVLHNVSVTKPPANASRSLPPAVLVLLVVAAVLVGGAALLALIEAIGLTGVVMLAGVVGSFAFVVLTVARRRPVGLD